MTITYEEARAIAYVAHHGQTDKGHKPYFEHVEAVASRFPRGSAEAVYGYLHDVMEDTKLDVLDLRALGASDEQLIVLSALTHRPSEPRRNYMRRIVEDGGLPAVRVKFADMAHNTLPERVVALSDKDRARLKEKYETDYATISELVADQYGDRTADLMLEYFANGGA